MDGMTIGAVAREANVNVETIRYYQRIGLLPQPARRYGRVRRYASQDLSRIRFVRAAQRLGFSLAEVRQLLKLEDGMNCTEARRLAERRLEDVGARLVDLTRINDALKAYVVSCKTRRGNVSCPLIEALLAPARVRGN